VLKCSGGRPSRKWYFGKLVLLNIINYVVDSFLAVLYLLYVEVVEFKTTLSILYVTNQRDSNILLNTYLDLWEGESSVILRQ